MSFLFPSDTCPTIFPEEFMTGLAYGASGRFWAPPMYILRVWSMLTEGEVGGEGGRTNGSKGSKRERESEREAGGE